MFPPVAIKTHCCQVIPQLPSIPNLQYVQIGMSANIWSFWGNWKRFTHTNLQYASFGRLPHKRCCLNSSACSQTKTFELWGLWRNSVLFIHKIGWWASSLVFVIVFISVVNVIHKMNSFRQTRLTTHTHIGNQPCVRAGLTEADRCSVPYVDYGEKVSPLVASL